MGVRLVRYTRHNNEIVAHDDHDELLNRDLMNQHPIYAITGLQEVLNILEDSIYDTGVLLQEKDKVTNKRIDLLIQQDIADINQALLDIGVIISELNVVDNVEETYTIKMEYDASTNTLKGNVKVFVDRDDTNAIQVLTDGLYVPKTITEETDTIKWVEESLGETLSEIYDNGMRFSHHTSSWSNVFNANEANAWYWDDNLQSFVQPQNTSYFNGFVTQNFYDYYTHTATIRSTNSDDDTNGLVIGFVFDENGNPHTLTLLVDSGGMGMRYGLVYDYYLPDQQILFTAGNCANGTIPGNRGGGWSSRSAGVTMRVTKHKNIVTAACSDWNNSAINENTLITIDLNNYSWGHLFTGAVRYGYCNISQASSFYQDIDFHSENMASASKFFASVKVSQESNNAITINEDGLHVPAFVISPDASNSLELRDNGYFAQGLEVSTQDGNALEKLDDGTFYVREHANVKVVNQDNHGFEIGDFIYYHPIEQYQLASAIDDYDSNIVGMVTKVVNADNFEYQWSGFYATDIFSTANGFAQGMPLYISDTIPGKTTQEQPDISKAVGYPVEDAGLVISIERGIQYNQEATIGDFKTSANTYNVRSDGFIKITEGIDYKQSITQALLDVLSDEFKASFIVINNANQTMEFINTSELYEMHQVPNGLNLFIKAF